MLSGQLGALASCAYGMKMHVSRTLAGSTPLVRRQLWEHLPFSMSQQETDLMKIPRALLERFTEALCYAA